MPLDPRTKVDKCIVEFLSKAPFPFKNGYNGKSLNEILKGLVKYVQNHVPYVSNNDICNEMKDIDHKHKNYLEVYLTPGSNKYIINSINASHWVNLEGRKFLYDISYKKLSDSKITNNYNYSGNNQIINNGAKINTQNNHSCISINKITDSSFNKGIKKLLSCENKMNNIDKKQLDQLISQLKNIYQKKNNKKHGLLHNFKEFIKKTYPVIRNGLSIVLAAIELKNQIM